MATKKITKKSVATKAPVKKEIVMEKTCGCGTDCPCHCHGHAHWVKHIIVWAIIFALGMVCGKMMNCGHAHKQMQKTHPVFVNGCLDMTSVSAKMQEKLAAADINGDECVSVEEYKAMKKSMQPEYKSRFGKRKK